MQSWGISRFNGQLSMLELSVERAGAALACGFSSSEELEAAAIRAGREAGMFNPIAQMHVILCATAISALAVLLLILL